MERSTHSQGRERAWQDGHSQYDPLDARSVEPIPYLIPVSETLSVPGDWPLARREGWAAWDVAQHPEREAITTAA